MSHPERLPILSESESRAVLAPHAAGLRRCIENAFGHWEALCRDRPDLRAPLGPTARASFVYAHMVAQAKREFADVPGVTLVENRGFLSIYVEDKAVVRFKKFDAARRVSSIPTRHAQQYFAQMRLPGMGEGTRHVVGYQLDDLGIAITDILVVVPLGKSNRFWYSLNAPAGGSYGESPAPVTPLTPSGDERTTVAVDPTKSRRRRRSKEA